MWLQGVVVRKKIDILILLILTPLVSVLFYSSIPTFCSFLIYIIIYIVVIIEVANLIVLVYQSR